MLDDPLDELFPHLAATTGIDRRVAARTRRVGEHPARQRHRRVVAIEVKLATTVADRDVRHLHWLQDSIGDRVIDKVVVTTGEHAYRRSDGVAVVPFALLGA